MRGEIDKALDDVGRLGTPSPAICVDRRRIREHAVHLGMDRRNAIHARQQRPVQVGGHAGREEREIRAEIRDRAHAEAEHVAVGIERELGVSHVIASLRVGEETLTTCRRPLHRASDLLRRPREYAFLGIDEDLGAEAAADIGRDDAELVLGNAEDERAHDEPMDVRILRRDPQRQVIRALIIARQRRARLHGDGGEALVR